VGNQKAFETRRRLSPRFVLVIVAVLTLLLGSGTYAAFVASGLVETNASRVAAFNVRIIDVTDSANSVDIESGSAGANNWKLDLYEKDAPEVRKFTINNNSEVSVKCTPVVSVLGTFGTPIYSFTPGLPAVVAPAGTSNLNLSVSPATLGANEWSRVEKMKITFLIEQVN
jgi:hypothetical protein